MTDPRTPCIIGVAQRTWRDTDAPEPLEMWAEVATAAASDSGASDVLGRIDSVRVVHCLSWPYDDPPERLAERLGVSDGHRFYSGIGGTTPQVLLNDAAAGILAGDHDLVLIAGGEALATKKRLKKAGERPAWSHRRPGKTPFPLEAPIHPGEISHGFLAAFFNFALFDVARRAHLGAEPDAYRAELGTLLAPLTRVAAENPHAWFPIERSAEEIATPTAENRMVGYPYTKYMVAMMDVDMAAGLLLASEETADALGVPRDRRVYPRGWAYGAEVANLAERDEMWASPGIGIVAGAALDAAGAVIADVGHLDLYSCFSSSLLLACDALGIDPAERALTVTGGLPYAGGPVNNYMAHSIAAMAETLRADPGALGLVSGVGMYMTKHVYGAYSTEPGAVAVPDGEAIQARIDDLPRREIVEEHTGPATIVAYTISYGRDGEPEALLAICELADGRRCYARGEDPELVRDAERSELVGREVEVVASGGGVNVVKG